MNHLILDDRSSRKIQESLVYSQFYFEDPLIVSYRWSIMFPSIFLYVAVVAVALAGFTTASYQVGVGIHDCTGPAAGVTFVSINRKIIDYWWWKFEWLFLIDGIRQVQTDRVWYSFETICKSIYHWR